MADACAITGYTRNQLRGMLRDLPSFVGHESPPGSARTFARSELLMACVITELERRYGIRRSAIGAVVPRLTEALERPSATAVGARLALLFEPCTVTLLAEDANAVEGVLIPLGPIFDRVERYLGGYADAGAQAELPLGQRD